MFKKLKYLSIFFLVALSFIQPAMAVDVPPPPNQQNVKIEYIDTRSKILDDYLAQYNSPLTGKGKDFVEAADKYGVDWRLVPAIAGAESTFGQKIPGGHHPAFTSYNGWGWGVYGNNVINFKSWKDAIFAVTKGIKQNYIDEGLTNPQTINRKYSTSTDWADAVNYFLQDLTDYTKTHPTELMKVTPVKEPDRIFLNDAYLKVNNYNFSLMFVDN